MELAREILEEKITALKEEQPKEKEEGRVVDKTTDTWVETTGGVKDTIGRKAKILKATKLFYWLLDGEVIYRRLKSNTTKLTYCDNSDDDTICIPSADEVKR